MWRTKHGTLGAFKPFADHQKQIQLGDGRTKHCLIVEQMFQLFIAQLNKLFGRLLINLDHILGQKNLRQIKNVFERIDVRNLEYVNAIEIADVLGQKIGAQIEHLFDL